MSPNKIQGTKPGGTHVTGPGGLTAAEFAKWYRAETVKQWESLDLEAVARLAQAVVHCQESGKQIFAVGNGGSASSSSHIACDLMKTAAVPGRKPVKCLSLSDNAALMTACGNDLSFDDVFSRQLENLCGQDDLVILISGSGNSPNLVKAAEIARSRGAKTAALLGFDGGKLKNIVDIVVHMPCDQYGVIEDLHMSIGHIITFYLKQRK